MRDPSRIRVPGPLEPYAEGFRGELAGRGYSPGAAAVQLQLMAHLSGWLAGRGLDPAGLTSALWTPTWRSAAGWGVPAQPLDTSGVGAVAGVPATTGVVPAAATPGPAGPVAALLGRYARWLAAERGLAQTTIQRNVELVRPFVAGWEAAGGVALEHDQTLPASRTQPETAALLDAPDQATWTGRRDHALLALAVHTGLRVLELTALTLADVRLGTGAHVSCLGKGPKQRITPLTGDVAAVLHAWQTKRGGLPPSRCSRPAAAPAQPRRRPTAPDHPRRHRRGDLPDPCRQSATAHHLGITTTSAQDALSRDPHNASAVTTTPARSRRASSGRKPGTSPRAPSTWRWASTAAGVVHRGQQVDLPAVGVGDASQRLAVDRQGVPPPASTVPVGQPRTDGTGQGLRVQAAQGPADGGLGWDGPVVGGVAAGAERSPDRLGRRRPIRRSRQATGRRSAPRRRPWPRSR
jgi:hypothetical protein